MNQIYLETARLLTQVAPLVFVDDTFALKGGDDGYRGKTLSRSRRGMRTMRCTIFY
jgi:hypothetical protein